jgi:WD40 repeat protein
MATLNALPNEILSLVTNHLEHPRDVLHLSLASRRLSQFARLDGWKAFLKGRFGISGLDSDARNSVHGLTTLYRNWHRKGFIAKYLEPSLMTTSINTWQKNRWRGPRGQTMGYQPSIDSYEEVFGAWNERREVLAWSAGTQLVMRVKETGKPAKQKWEEELERGSSDDSTCTFDAFKHHSSWWTYKIPDSFEGRDDITSMKLLRPHQRSGMSEDVVFGTASGQLSLLSWDARQDESREQHYNTGNRAVGSVSVSPGNNPMLAATLGDTTLALYPIEYDATPQDPVEPLAQSTPILPGVRNGRIWSCAFLSDDKVALGFGPSHEPILIYDVVADGVLSQPGRTFSLDAMLGKDSQTNHSARHSTSIYPLLPIPGTTQGGSVTGNVFLSGGYDGITRLHDLRSPRGFETMFWDPTNDSSIYSLAIQGLERIVAGVSMHSMIKVFDLRLSGSHVYQTISMPSKPEKKIQNGDYAYNAIVNGTDHRTSTVSGGWNLYLNPRVPPKRNAYREDYWRGGQDSPVYSLSIPSPTSPNIYAGLEGVVQSLTFHSIADPHPDTSLSQSVVRFPDSGAVDISSSYNPQGDALNLGMYEQGTEEGLGMQLLVQDGVTTSVMKDKERGADSKAKGFDERWKDIRDEGNRWARGDVPQGSHGAGRGRGRGRGHGRGRGGRGRGRGGGRGA